MADIKIDKKIPFPKRVGVEKYPLGQLGIGDSFFVIGGSHNAVSGSYVGHRPKKFSARLVTENGKKGLRVWRIK